MCYIYDEVFSIQALLWHILLTTASPKHKYRNVKQKASQLATSGTLALAMLAQIPAGL